MKEAQNNQEKESFTNGSGGLQNGVITTSKSN